MSKTIPLTQGYATVVDDEDYAGLSRWSWCARCGGHGKVYAGRGTWKKAADGTWRKLTLLMHREIMNAPKGTQVDHIDGNPMNNTRANLRFANSSQQAANTRKQAFYGQRPTSSQYKGVCELKPAQRGRRWLASITVNNKTIYLGQYRHETAAAFAYDRAALRYFGEYASINFPWTKELQSLDYLPGWWGWHQRIRSRL